MKNDKVTMFYSENFLFHSKFGFCVKSASWKHNFNHTGLTAYSKLVRPKTIAAMSFTWSLAM